MRAKCKICGEPLDTKTAYKVITLDKNNKEKKAYYCNQEEYEADAKKKEKVAADKDKVYRLICEIINRKEITNTALFSEWKIWNKVASNEKIGSYLEENKTYLCSVISRLEDKEFNRIRYLSAILKNKLGDYTVKVTVKEIVKPKIQDEHYKTKFKLKPRRGFEDLEDDCDE
jgi:hypothetical protein